MNAPDSKIAVTLYNLRDYCKTPEDLDKTLEKVAAMGYKCIQVSGTPLDPKIIRASMDKHGLYCCATHERLATFQGESAPIIERMQILGCPFTALGSPGEFDYTSLDSIKQLADMFNRQCEELGKAGIQLGYHNHFAEFTRVAGSKKTMFETFMDLTDKRVCSELDVHWVTRGGGSPVAWITKLAGRISVIHFKDFAVIEKEPRFCEIGEGNLDWPSILTACEKTGVRWYSIEQDRETPNRNIFDSIKISIDNLHAMGVR